MRPAGTLLPLLVLLPLLAAADDPTAPPATPPPAGTAPAAAGTVADATTPAAWGSTADAPAGQAAPAPVAKPAATVLSDRLEVTIDASGKARSKRTWTVRIDDPSRCTAGLVTPDGLDGAGDGGARVLERLLLVPDGATAGQTYTLTATRSDTRGPSSGVFETAPDLPTEQASVTVKAPASVPLAVWADDEAHASFTRADTRTADVSWDALDGQRPAQVVWTTWHDWLQAGTRLDQTVTPLLAPTARDLGREMGSDLSGISVALAAERVFKAIPYQDGGDERWEAAHKTSQVLAAKQGSGVDRGVVLLSVLRAAGYDARPAWYRSPSETGSVPLSVPAPALLDHPAVAVILPGRTLFVDPADDRVAIPETPAAIVGGSVWVPGDLPYGLANAGVVDGTVSIAGQMTIATDGAETFSATISADGVAAEHLRTLLGPLSEADRKEALRRLVATGRPRLDRFAADMSGIDDPYRPLRITVQGYDGAALQKIGVGLTGSIPPLMAPALAAWLPPRVLVHEDLSAAPPSGLVPLSVAASQPAFHPDATLSRTFHREGARIIVVTEAERPYRVTSAGRDASAGGFLDGQAPIGPDVLLTGAASPDLVKALRTTPGRPEAELAVLEAMLWWNTEQPKKAEKAIARAAASASPADLKTYLERHVPKDDVRPWVTLWENSRTDDLKLAAVEGLADAGQARESWIRAANLAATSANPDVRVRALLLQERYEGPKPDPAVDPGAVPLWKEPDQLVADAAAAGAQLPGASADGDPRVLVRQAERALAAGKSTDAEVALDKALRLKQDPVAMVLLAEASAASGVAVGDVVKQIDDAVALAPFDAEVIGDAAHAMAAVGRRDRAVAYALSAARIAHDSSPRWLQASGYALAAGDLTTALYAARRASDLDPKSVDAGYQLELCGTLASDQQSTMLGASRDGARRIGAAWPPTMDALMGLAPEDGLLALLQYHDAEVIGSPSMLSLRAWSRLDAGFLDGAARDGTLLASRYGQPRGTAIAFAATAGRLWSAASLEALDAAAKADYGANTTRMEYRLITGIGDPAQDARANADDPRAQVVLRAAKNPEATAAEVAGWPGDIPDPKQKVPRGFKPNRLLTAAKGVVAWSDPERAIAVLRVGRSTGTLPPPLPLLYTPASPPLMHLEGGGQVVRLEGGAIPLYAAIRLDGDQEVTGLGYTPNAAIAALMAGLGG